MDSDNHSNILPNDFKDEKVKGSAVSINSATTDQTLVADNTPFRPGRSLFINARGIRAIRLPLPSSELEIPIYDADGNLVYISTRERKCSGNAILSSPKGGELVSTKYTFGPGNNPVIRQMHPSDSKASGDIEVRGKFTSRATSFVLPDGKTFEWSYVRSKQLDGKKRTLLVLNQVDSSSSSSETEHRIAQLVRSDETRPAGATRHSAGNGGELVLDENAVEWIDEHMVVSTCILMLKKEIDRRRLIQAAIIAGGASGGS